MSRRVAGNFTVLKKNSNFHIANEAQPIHMMVYEQSFKRGMILPSAKPKVS